MKNFQLLRKYLKEAGAVYIAAILCCTLTVIFTSVVPLVVKTTIDSIVGTEPVAESHILVDWVFRSLPEDKLTAVFYCAAYSVFLTLIGAVCQFISTLFAIKSSERISKKLRDDLYGHILKLPFSYHSRAEAGDLIQRCTHDVGLIATFISNHVINIFKIIFLVGTILYLMLQQSVVMTGISMVIIPFIMAYCIYFFIKVSKHFEKREEADSAMTSVLQENLTGVRVVKAFARQNYEIEKFEKVNGHFRKTAMGVTKLMAQFWMIAEGLSLLQTAIVIILGAWFVLNGMLGLGLVVAFFAFVGQLLWPVKELGMILAQAGMVKVALKRIGEIFENKPEVLAEAKEEPAIGGEIEFRNVSFSYDGEDRVLKNISFKLQKGQTLAIMGGTGSGKSTLVNLLQRFYDNYKGTIFIDGVDIQKINKEFLRQQVSLILQEPFLFNRTVEENLMFSKKGATKDEVVAAAETSCIHESIEEFEKGYETIVGEGGVTLSGGQKQRLAIARNLIKKNPVVIFDDSLSAVDTETDRIIRDRLQKDENRPTAIIISHRLSTVKEADLILILENGEITASGTHEEIKDQESLYRRILQIQDEIEKEFQLGLRQES